MKMMKDPSVGSAVNAGERCGKVTCSVPGSVKTFGLAP